MNITSAHIAAIAAFSLWGLFPLYWKLFSNVGAWDLFGHRLIWSFVSLILILIYKNKLSALKEIWSQKKIRYMLMISALLISSNWLLYIYAVNIGKVLEASMGYFLNPLINVFVGWLILKEEVRKTQWPAILLAMTAIFLMALQTDMANFPWIAIVLSLTFALYGLIRKVTHVGALEGLAFETCFMIGPVMIYWFFHTTTPLSILSQLENWKLLVLVLSGLITCIPLILFAYSTRRLKLQTLGFIQFLSPSLKFICGLLVLHEPLSQAKLQTFYLIWIALIWYTTESFFFLKRKQKIPIPIPE
jgi:chloramphenicol-sensitive protein RarD